MQSPRELLERQFDCDVELAHIEQEIAEAQVAEQNQLEQQKMSDFVREILGINVDPDHTHLKRVVEGLELRGAGKNNVLDGCIRAEVHKAVGPTGSIEAIAGFLDHTAQVLRMFSGTSTRA